MNASATIKQHPWAFSLALAIVACSLADVSLALRLRSAGVERGRSRPNRVWRARRCLRAST
jgi:hypothetical protein